MDGHYDCADQLDDEYRGLHTAVPFQSLGGGHTLGCLLRISHFLRLGGLAGARLGCPGALAGPDHDAGKYCNVRVHADSTIPAGKQGTTGLPTQKAATLKRLLDLLRQGVTPEKIALAIAAGAILGIFPVLGSTTLLCAGAAALLGLNLPLIQLVNAVVYPLQLILLIPLLQAGQWLFGEPMLPITMPKVMHMIQASVWNTVTTLGSATARAVVVWLLAGWAAGVVIYFASLFPLRWIAKARA